MVPRDANVSVDELRAHCTANLASYKVPVEIELRETLPQSAVGKILYRVLRDELPRVETGQQRAGVVARLSAVSPFCSSIFAIASRCTSSGPSARRSVRAWAHACASGKSSVTPAPPCA